jgi:hypothetical protein
MPVTNPLFWESLSFSSLAVAIVVASTWWLYWSPVRARGAAVARPSPRLAGGVVGLLGLSALLLVGGAFWDASLHIRTGNIPAGADFLWPPHLMIYGAFLLSFVVAGLALGLVAVSGWRSGQRDPRQWVRRNPYLGAVALASLYSLLSIPGDALWHALYGIDLTAWSPPHVILGVMSCTVLVCALSLLAQSRAGAARRAWYDAASLALISLMLNVAYLIGVIEWELPGAQNPLVLARPIWLYPLVGGALAFFALRLAQKLTVFRWAATAVAVAFLAVRVTISGAMALTGNVVPFLPVWFSLGALLMDLVAQRHFPSALAAELAPAAAFTLGYAVLALPALAVRGSLPAFSGADLAVAAAATLAASLLLLPVVRETSARLQG